MFVFFRCDTDTDVEIGDSFDGLFCESGCVTVVLKFIETENLIGNCVFVLIGLDGLLIVRKSCLMIIQPDLLISSNFVSD